MSDMELLCPALAAVLPGLWSWGHRKRMMWAALVLMVLPVLVTLPGSMLLGAAGLTWRSAVRRVCGMSFVTGCAMLFVWAGAWFWRQVPAGRWHISAGWLCRSAGVAVIGFLCLVFTMFSSFLALCAADADFTEARTGQTVVTQYLWHDGCNYYAYYGPLICGTELLEDSTDLMR